MRSVLPSQVTQQLYRGAPNLNFAYVVRDICKTLTLVGCPTPRLTWDCEDIAVLDLTAARVVIGFTENIPGPYATCLTVAIGQSTLNECALLEEADQIALSRKISDLLDQRCPSDAQHSRFINQPLTTDLIDQVVDALFQLPDAISNDAPVLTSIADVPDISLQTKGPEYGDMDRLMRRLSSELVERAPSLISRAIASASPKARIQSNPVLHERATNLSALPGSPTATKTKSGLFWSEAKPGQPQRPADNIVNAEIAARRISSNELKALRAALYAADAGRPAGPRRIVEQTKLAFKILADLSHNLGSPASDKSRAERSGQADRAKH